MTVRAALLGFAALLLCSTRVVCAADAVEKKYALPEKGIFQMNVPAGWSDELKQVPQNRPPTIALRARQGPQFEILVTPVWRARADAPAPTRDTIRQSVERAAQDAKSQAVEKDIRPVEFAGASGPGFYFSATDRAPKASEFKYMTQGMLKVGELVATFTILTNDGQEQVVRDALAMLKSAAHLPPK